VTCAVASTLLIAPDTSHACWLFNWCKPKTTTYRPVCAAPACNPCQQQTMRYVPQTAYRPVTQSVPVTSYRPVTSCDPCTGCPVTCMRPVTSYVQRVSYVPYTTYRPVVTTTAYACPTVGCATGACGTAAGYATSGYATGAYGSTYAAPATASTGSCCTPSYTPAPATSYTPAPVTAPTTAPTTAPATSPSVPATEPRPSIPLNQEVPQGTPSTYLNPTSGVESPPPVSSAASQSGAVLQSSPGQQGYYPPPPNTKPAASPTPQLIDPRDRTAATPAVGPRLRRPLFTALATANSHYSPAVPAAATLPVAPTPTTTVSAAKVPAPAVAASTPDQEQLDAAGWRASR
jgi:hypothetical protein